MDKNSPNITVFGAIKGSVINSFLRDGMGLGKCPSEILKK